MAALVRRHVLDALRRGAIAAETTTAPRALFSAQAAPSTNPYHDVPAGHINSDLSQAASNIGLMRRRELALGAAGEIRLAVAGAPRRLADLFVGHRTVIFGVPDCGKVCSESHVPGFVKHADALKAAGATQVLCVAVGPAAEAEAWGRRVGADGSKVAVAADESGAFTRLLGLELAPPGAPGPKSLRYGAVVNKEGVLLKIRVDKTPGECKVSAAAAIVELLKSCAH